MKFKKVMRRLLLNRNNQVSNNKAEEINNNLI